MADCRTLTPEEYRAARKAFDAHPRDIATVKGWQARLGVTADGIPGPKTFAALTYAAPKGASSDGHPSAGIVVLPRSAWGAKPHRGRTSPLGRVRRITVHHTATATLPRTRAETLDQTRQVQGMHHGQRWADIGYHFLIGQDGTVTQGREPHRDHADPLQADLANGSHVGGKNTGNIGISVLGYFHAPKSHRMTPEATEALAAVLRALCARYGLSGRDIVGHRELAATACPGDTLMPVVEQIRRSL